VHLWLRLSAQENEEISLFTNTKIAKTTKNRFFNLGVLCDLLFRPRESFSALFARERSDLLQVFLGRFGWPFAESGERRTIPVELKAIRER